MKHLFVTGTDTNVGKTFISSALCLFLRRRYFKPVQTGTIEGSDREFVAKIIGEANTLPEIYSFPQPFSPHLAAQLENSHIDFNHLRQCIRELNEPLVIEGAGGVLVPLNEKQLLIDLIKTTPCEVVIVSRSSLGTINHTLLTLQALRAQGIEPLGVIVNGEKNQDNENAIAAYGKTKIIASVGRGEETKEWLGKINFDFGGSL